jgi:hypothetical protein
MNVNEMIFRAKERIALEEIDAAEAQKRLILAQAKLQAQQTQAAKDLRTIPSLTAILIIGNTFFWSVLISLWFSH